MTPAPRKPYVQNTLFTRATPANLNACVGRNGGPYNLVDYARGYVRATERLVASLGADSLWVDTIIYPLVFDARHAVELYLKHFVHTLSLVFDVPQNPKSTHELVDNWALVEPLLRRGSEISEPNPFDTDAIGEAARILEDLVHIDPTGEAFRFPWERDRSRFLQETSLINARVFGETMARLFETFDRWDTVCWSILDSRERQP